MLDGIVQVSLMFSLVNGISIPSAQRTTAQSGVNIVITFDTAAIQYSMRPEFEIVLVGKFS